MLDRLAAFLSHHGLQIGTGYPRDANGVRFEIKLQGPRGRYLNDANVVQAIGQFLTDVGVQTEVELLEWASVYSPLTRTKEMGPLFVLGIWWRGLTARGAALGMAAGGSVATIGIALTLIRDTTATTVGDALLAQPAAVSVPVAFATMIAVSRLDHARQPRDVEGHMRALHAPEGLGLEAGRAR